MVFLHTNYLNIPFKYEEGMNIVNEIKLMYCTQNMRTNENACVSLYPSVSSLSKVFQS